MCIIEKKARKSIAKRLKVDFLWNRGKEKEKLAHDTMQFLKNVVHYLNMKMPDILVEIIDLQPFSSIK